jgi:acetylornithine deacetylase/succinyl-diaminopimelate desuccinylase-like protein
MLDLLQYAKENEANILADVERVVKAESPTQDKEAVDRCGQVFQSLFAQYLGLTAEVIPMNTTGNHLRFTYGEGSEQILILGHMDTVWDIGRLSYRVEGNKAFGPGILDMKSGIVQAIWAVKACKDLGIPLSKKVVFLCTSDEETGSLTSRSYIEEEAQKSDVILVVERVSALITQAKPRLEGTSLQISGEVNRPPMERTAETEKLFHIAADCASSLGITLTEAHVGGGSDGNFTAALGIPTLDGLGAVGDGPHAEYEHILVDQLPVRTALLAGLLSRV